MAEPIVSSLVSPPFDPDLVAAWDAFVAHAGGDLVQTAAWGAVKAEQGAVVHLLVLRRGHDIVAGASVHVRRVVPGVRIATVSKGPVVQPGDGSAARAVVDELEHTLASLGTRAAVIQCPHDAGDLDALLDPRRFAEGAPPIAPVATTWLDLSRSDDDLQRSMSNMRKRNVRSSSKTVDSGELVVGFDEAPAEFHRLHAASAERQGFEPLAITTLDAQWRHLAPQGLVHSLVARHEGVAVAGIWLTSFGGTVTYKLPGWDPSLKQPKHVNEALHWYAIRWARSIGATRYDLGGFDRSAAEAIVAGRDLPAGFERTPSNFKLGFGGTVELQPLARLHVRAPLVGAPVARVAIEAMTSPRARRWIGRFRNR